MKLTRQVIREAILREIRLLSEQKQDPMQTQQVDDAGMRTAPSVAGAQADASGPIDISDEDDEAPAASGPRAVPAEIKKSMNDLLFDTDDEGDARSFVAMWGVYGDADKFEQDVQMREMLRVASGQSQNSRYEHGEPLLNADGSPVAPEAAPEPEQTVAAAIVVGDYAPPGDPYSYDFTSKARKDTIASGEIHATVVAMNGQKYGPATFKVPPSNPLHDMIMSDIGDSSSENYDSEVAGSLGSGSAGRARTGSAVSVTVDGDIDEIFEDGGDIDVTFNIDGVEVNSKVLNVEGELEYAFGVAYGAGQKPNVYRQGSEIYLKPVGGSSWEWYVRVDSSGAGEIVDYISFAPEGAQNDEYITFDPSLVMDAGAMVVKGGTGLEGAVEQMRTHLKQNTEAEEALLAPAIEQGTVRQLELVRSMILNVVSRVPRMDKALRDEILAVAAESGALPKD